MTVTTAPMFNTEKRSALPGTRLVGLLTAATGVAALALLAFHPGDTAKTFADVLRNEAANRLADGIVHGGFIAVLALQMVCYTVFSAQLGLTRTATIAGLVFFAMGTMFLSGSMVLDGLVTPAVAAKYLAAPAKIEYAKSLFVLIGALISFLMPLGLAFQSAAIAAWGWALVASGMSRVLGVIAMLAGAGLVAALASSFAAMNPFALMGAMAAIAAWAMAAGVLLARR
ncbi:MAG TPA: hypothetical protein VNU97_13165 [Rhizomicrobium sp.]|jgi:hypothetical protein|nr:hypothetical protein [Rhizomicrobium sp.]